MKKAKYVRVSTLDQNTDRQNKVEDNIKLYEDKTSGLIPFKQRPSGKKLIEDIENGKINYVIIHSVDRLGRNVIDMQKQLNWFIDRKIQIYAENIKIELLNEDGSMNNIAKMIIDLLGSVAGMEIEALKIRQMEGIATAKARGIYKGRKIGATMDSKDLLKRHKDIIGLLKNNVSLNKISKYTGKAFVTYKKVKLLLDNQSKAA